MINTPRVLFAAPSSNTGKTTVTCGVLKALKNRGLSLCSFKCGPDFVDPLFHRSVLGISSTNLDMFFLPREQVRGQLAYYSQGKDMAVLEGVMGLYDGIGTTSDASSWQVAVETKTPIILIVNPKGMAMSVAALVKGFADFKRDNSIQGVILNRCSPHLYSFLSGMIKDQTGIPVLGYLPEDEEIAIESWHLGLKPEKEQELELRFEKLAKQVEESIDLDKIIQIANISGDLIEAWSPPETSSNEIRIGIAQDKAFSFMYRENLDILKGLGGELVYFSPLKDKFPENLSGLYLGGGYLDHYIKELSNNVELLKEIKNAFTLGMPVYAEGSGFLYLHKNYRKEENLFPLLDIISETGEPSSRLGNFGYFHGKMLENLYGDFSEEPLRGHEFHYSKSSNTGSHIAATKPTGSKEWTTNYLSDQLFAGFPYFYFPGNPIIPQSFVKACKEFRKDKESRHGI